MAAGAAAVPGLAQCALALLAASRAGTRLSRLTRLPLITVHLGFGAAAHAFGLIDRPVLGALAPAHAAALGVITIAAGSELALGDLRTHARLIRALAAGMTIAALAIVFGLTLLLLSQFPAIGGEPDARLHAVVASLAATIAVARSPSSAIAVVTELRAEGHFTQTLLGATMVTDVLAMVLFTAAAEIAEIVLAPAGADDGGPAAPGVLGWAAAFAFGTVYQLLLSTAHGVLVGSFALLALRTPRAAQPAALLAAAGVAFHGEAMVRWLVGARADRSDVEPMLACMIAGSLLSNAWRRRRPLDAVLRRLMPHVLLFFFTTTGADMDFSALAHAWPLALYLCARSSDRDERSRRGQEKTVGADGAPAGSACASCRSSSVSPPPPSPPTRRPRRPAGARTSHRRESLSASPTRLRRDSPAGARRYAPRSSQR